MELVSASKMRKAQTAAASSRPYAKLSSELLKNLTDKVTLEEHPLFKRPMPERPITPKHKTLLILISSDKGLAGSLNTNVINQAIRIIRDEGAKKMDFISVGKKGTDALRRLGVSVTAVFPSKDRGLSALDAKPIAKIAIDEYLQYTYDKVFVVYTDFISTLVQKPAMLQILPLGENKADANPAEYEFEPDMDEVLDHLMTRYIEFAVYQCMQEAVASEHSARMVAMRNANQSASDLIEDLTLSANQARQSGITRELSEISAAKLAMEG
jgi:F-type H+-transporting ATPase subunit gamma